MAKNHPLVVIKNGNENNETQIPVWPGNPF
jgi:hypothetical protein